MKMYKKKPIPIQALEYTVDNLNDIVKFVGVDNCSWDSVNAELSILTLEGVMRVEPGAFVIKGPKNEFYPCRGDVFKLTYEEIK